MTTVTASPPTARTGHRRGLSLGGKATLLTLAAATGVGSWVFFDGPRRGVGVGAACLLAGAWLLGPRLREYAGLALVIVGGLLAGTSLLWLLVVAPAVDGVEQRIHDVTHPSLTVPSVDVGGAAKGAVDRARDAASGLIGGRP